MILIVSQSALADFNRLQAFLAEKSPNAAQRAVAAIVQAIDSLMVNPDRGRRAAGDTRDLIVPFGRSSYLVRFLHDPQRGEIVIFRIWHGREAHD